ncbi:DUF3035 domain-containing protein [Azospirillum halopraeferens]|uniref:DUF3035 domain-containing protein n=1 Tax=Azospirillum halopraeferens TaxID=34010 RepID=UPI00048C53A0|nr:DUF3035 domain-containing protein [Azospirillum halopraeferens]
MSSLSLPPRRRTVRPLLVAAIAALALAGCSDVRRSIGLDRTSPDEFAVVSRAPLTLPPDMRLPAPRPGAARPNEPSPTAVAEATVFGTGGVRQGGRSAGSDGPGSTGESALLSRAGADRVDPRIRATVDQETTQLIIADRSWVDSLLFWQTQEAPYSVVDPTKEAQRLRSAQATGQPLNEGAVPTITRRRKAPFEGLF